MYKLTIYLFLSCLYQSVISKNDVLEWTPDSEGYQLTFPNQKDDGIISSENFEIKSASGAITFSIICERYNLMNPIAKMYTTDGIFLDFVVLYNAGDRSCSENYIKKHIIITDRETKEGPLKIIYVWPRRLCTERIYTLNIWNFMALVDLPQIFSIDCPPEVSKTFPKSYTEADEEGVVSMGPVGKMFTMDYINHLKEKGLPQTLTSKDIALSGNPFRFTCREDTLLHEDPSTRKSTVLTGSIEMDDGIILERFTLSSCNIDNIIVSQKSTGSKTTHCTVLFRNSEGTCYKREYDTALVSISVFNEVTIKRLKAKQVRCPKMLTKSDVKIRWWKRLSNLFPSRK